MARGRTGAEGGWSIGIGADGELAGASMSRGGGGSGALSDGGMDEPGPGGGAADYRAYLYVGVMIVLGSTTAAAARYVVRELPPAWIPVVRFGIAGLLLLPAVADRHVLGRLLRR